MNWEPIRSALVMLNFPQAADANQEQLEKLYKEACRIGVMTPLADKDFVAPENIIDQKIVPSFGTKLVCTACKRTDWHTLVLRRRRGLIEGLCKQQDGSGCYPSASRSICHFTDAEGVNCLELAEFEILDQSSRKVTESCATHLGLMMPDGPGYQIYPLED